MERCDFDSAVGNCEHSLWNDDNFLIMQQENAKVFQGTMIILKAQQENESTLNGTMVVLIEQQENMKAFQGTMIIF